MKDYLKKRGYIQKIVKGKDVFVKGFVCVNVSYKGILIWVDGYENNKLHITHDVWSHLPIALDNFERLYC